MLANQATHESITASGQRRADAITQASVAAAGVVTWSNAKRGLFFGCLTAAMALALGNWIAKTVTAKPRESVFCGRWVLVNDDGRISSYLSVTGGKAKREHADGECLPERADGEMRLSWPDGFRDKLVQRDGKLWFFGLPRWSDSWDDKPRFTLLMERR